MPKVLSIAEVNEFRERLCRAAERLFAERGPEAVTMRQLAEELGVSPMTPYRYFRDKDDILAAVRTKGFNQFAQVLEAARTLAVSMLRSSRSTARVAGRGWWLVGGLPPTSHRLPAIFCARSSA